MRVKGWIRKCCTLSGARRRRIDEDQGRQRRGAHLTGTAAAALSAKTSALCSVQWRLEAPSCSAGTRFALSWISSSCRTPATPGIALNFRQQVRDFPAQDMPPQADSPIVHFDLHRLRMADDLSKPCTNAIV